MHGQPAVASAIGFTEPRLSRAILFIHAVITPPFRRAAEIYGMAHVAVSQRAVEHARRGRCRLTSTAHLPSPLA